MNGNTKGFLMRGLATAAVAVIAAATLAAPTPAAAADVLRVDGKNRYDTAAQVSEGLDQCDVVVANGETFADGLAGAVFAAPLLLTRADSLPTETVDELERVSDKCDGIDTILVLGGTAAVSKAVYNELKQYVAHPTHIDRVNGDDRYETAVAIAEYFIGLGSWSNYAMLATGKDFPDALAAGPVAGARGKPILLNDGGSLHPDVVDFFDENLTLVVSVVGGPAAVPDSVLDEISSLGIIAVRMAGPDRYATAAKVADQHWLGPTCTVVVNGNAFPDALAAGPLGGTDECPLALVQQNKVPGPTVNWLSTYSGTIDRVFAVGGSAVISDHTLDVAVAAAT